MKLSEFEYQFPACCEGSGLLDQIMHIASEVNEVKAAYWDGDQIATASELMDVIHCAETALRMLHATPADLNDIKCGVIAKNAARNYYNSN
jgi:hypothetical protein